MINVLEKCNLEQLGALMKYVTHLKQKAIKKHSELLFRNQWLMIAPKIPRGDCIEILKVILMLNHRPYMYINVSKYRIAISRLRLD